MRLEGESIFSLGIEYKKSTGFWNNSQFLESDLDWSLVSVCFQTQQKAFRPWTPQIKIRHQSKHIVSSDLPPSDLEYNSPSSGPELQKPVLQAAFSPQTKWRDFCFSAGESVVWRAWGLFRAQPAWVQSTRRAVCCLLRNCRVQR